MTRWRSAYDAVRSALKSGRLVKPTRCERCNKERKLESHHEDYNKPLEVKWFCRSCHGKVDEAKRLQGMYAFHIQRRLTVKQL